VPTPTRRARRAAPPFTAAARRRRSRAVPIKAADIAARIAALDDLAAEFVER
jgi:hypothetical protein